MVSGSRGHDDAGRTSPIQPGSPTSPPAAPGGPRKKNNSFGIKSPVVLSKPPAQQKAGVGSQQQTASGVTGIAKKALPLTPLQRNPALNQKLAASRAKTLASPLPPTPEKIKVTGSPAIKNKNQGITNIAQKTFSIPAQNAQLMAQGKALQASLPPIPRFGKQPDAFTQLLAAPNSKNLDAAANMVGELLSGTKNQDNTARLKAVLSQLNGMLAGTDKKAQEAAVELLERLPDSEQEMLFMQMNMPALQQIGRVAPDLEDIHIDGLNRALIKNFLPLLQAKVPGLSETELRIFIEMYPELKIKAEEAPLSLKDFDTTVLEKLHKGINQLEMQVNIEANKSASPRKPLDRAALEKAFAKGIVEGSIDLKGYMDKWDQLITLFTDPDKTALAWNFVRSLRPFENAAASQAASPKNAPAGAHAAMHSPESGVTRRGAHFTGAEAAPASVSASTPAFTTPETQLDQNTAALYNNFVTASYEEQQEFINDNVLAAAFINEPDNSVRYFIELSSSIDQAVGSDPAVREQFEQAQNGVNYLLEIAKAAIAAQPDKALQTLTALLQDYEATVAASGSTPLLKSSIKGIQDLIAFARTYQAK